MKRLNVILVAVLLAALSSPAVARTPKYVFFLIGDGMGINQAAATEMYMRSVGMGDLNFRHFPYVSFVSTYSSNDRVTDSAAGGTALATGFKTYNGAIGVKPDTTDVESLVDKAVRAGFAAGVVSSDAVNLATPASFYGDAKSRNDFDDIAGDFVDSKLCFAAGASIASKDFSNDYWVEQARQKGFRVFEGGDRYASCKGPVIYLSDNTGRNDLPYALDRKEGNTRLEDFTEAAIEHLYKNSPKGFFLMVEGALIDHACHSRDAGAMVNEVIDFSKSVDCVLRFYERHPDETLIVVTADHETGYTMITSGAAEYIGYQKCSVTSLTASLAEMGADGRIPGWPEVKRLLADKLGLWDKVPVSKKEEKVLTQLYKDTFLDGSSDVQKDLYNSNKKLAVEAVLLLGRKAGVTLFSGSHSGTPVGLYVKGARASEFSVCRENVDIPKMVAKVAGYK